MGKVVFLNFVGKWKETKYLESLCLSLKHVTGKGSLSSSKYSTT